ncbi:MAG: hypothetical protein VB126_08620 [Paludibacter sp.]|nr:hypothetical protein [Paludibacter sp.]
MKNETICFPQYCAHTGSNITLWIIFGIFIILFVLSFFKFFREGIKEISKWFIKRPIPVITISVILIIVVAFFVEKNGQGLFVNSNILSILSIVGIIGTIIGVLLTYEQLKIAEDRIDGYESFYKEVNELLCKKDTRSLQFYGPTLIPGHIAYNYKNDIDKYKRALQDNIEVLTKDPQNKIDLILYSEKQNLNAYNNYLHDLVNKTKIEPSVIESKLKELKKFQEVLNVFINNSITIIDDSTKVNLIDNYYFSNGVTAIYAVPLHYQVALSEKNGKNKSEKNRKLTPQLIGFKTTNRSIVQAFESKFDELKQNLNKNDADTSK